jgi:hypothetical protein
MTSPHPSVPGSEERVSLQSLENRKLGYTSGTLYPILSLGLASGRDWGFMAPASPILVHVLRVLYFALPDLGLLAMETINFCGLKPPNLQTWYSSHRNLT